LNHLAEFFDQKAKQISRFFLRAHRRSDAY